MLNIFIVNIFLIVNVQALTYKNIILNEIHPALILHGSAVSTLWSAATYCVKFHVSCLIIDSFIQYWESIFNDGRPI